MLQSDTIFGLVAVGCSLVGGFMASMIICNPHRKKKIKESLTKDDKLSIVAAVFGFTLFIAVLSTQLIKNIQAGNKIDHVISPFEPALYPCAIMSILAGEVSQLMEIRRRNHNEELIIVRIIGYLGLNIGYIIFGFEYVYFSKFTSVKVTLGILAVIYSVITIIIIAMIVKIIKGEQKHVRFADEQDNIRDSDDSGSTGSNDSYDAFTKMSQFL
jgi:hypothetical protein